MAKNLLFDSLSNIKPLNVNRFQAGLREFWELAVQISKQWGALMVKRARPPRTSWAEPTNEEGRSSQGLCLPKPVPYKSSFKGWSIPISPQQLSHQKRCRIQGCFLVMGSLSVPQFPYPRPLSWFALWVFAHETGPLFRGEVEHLYSMHDSYSRFLFFTLPNLFGHFSCWELSCH